MTISAWLAQAKEGDAEAIAALLNQSLKPKGVQVRAERDSYCLNLWITGSTLPPQAQLVDYLRRTIERLQLDSIGILRIEAEATADPSQSWTTEMALLAGLVQPEPRTSGGTASTVQTPADRLPDSHPLEINASGIGTTEPSHLGRHPSESQSPPPNVAALGPWEMGSLHAANTLPPKVARAYQELSLSPGASLTEIESTYFKTKAALIRQGNRASLEPLKWAFETLKDYLERQAHLPNPDLAETSIPEFDPTLLSGSPAPPRGDNAALGLAPDVVPILALQTLLQERSLPAQVSQQGDQLHIRWRAARVTNPKQATAQLYALLTQQDLVAMGLGDVTTLVVASLNGQNQAVWRQTLAMPQRYSVEEDTDLMSFNNRYSNGVIFPALLAIGLVLNASPITNMLLRGIKIWIHEFGHATVAWLAGRQAIPLPIGWTNVNPQRSLFVYLGVLILLGLLYWSGQKEGKHWPMVLAAGLALLQFAMTWLMSPNTFDMLLAFGGIGGELYLSTLLMVSFFFPMPAYWRWDFYRYPVVIAAAFTFWGQFWLWKAIRMGRASIPFGMMWGDAEGGDMNILVDRYAWEPGTIIGTYNTIANLCFLVIVGVYAYVLYRQQRHRFWLMLQR